MLGLDVEWWRDGPVIIPIPNVFMNRIFDESVACIAWNNIANIILS